VKYVALKALPDGQHPGDVFEIAEAIGQIFVLIGAARLADEDEQSTRKPARRRYQRRDLTAEV